MTRRRLKTLTSAKCSLFQAIEAKRVIGNYDTSLYLKEQVDVLRGRNEEIRSELRQSRVECTKLQMERDKAFEKVCGCHVFLLVLLLYHLYISFVSTNNILSKSVENIAKIGMLMSSDIHKQKTKKQETCPLSLIHISEPTRPP